MFEDKGKYLVFDSSEDVATVALFKEGTLVSWLETDGRKKHAAVLMPMIDDCLKAAELSMKELDELVVGVGPGSFTGVRVGISTAKGLIAPLEVPVKSFTYSTLLFSALLEQLNKENQDLKSWLEKAGSRFLILQSSGRNEFYVVECQAIYDKSSIKIRITSTGIQKPDAILENQFILADQKTAKNLWKQGNYQHIYEENPHVKHLKYLSLDLLEHVEDWVSTDISAKYYRAAQADEARGTCSSL